MNSGPTLESVEIENLKRLNFVEKGLLLLEASKNSDVEYFTNLLSQVKKCVSEDHLGEALSNAARHGHLGIVQILLKEAILYDYKGEAIRFAAGEGHLEVLKTLLTKVGHHTSVFWRGWALDEAAKAGHVEAVEIILPHLGHDFQCEFSLKSDLDYLTCKNTDFGVVYLKVNSLGKLVYSMQTLSHGFVKERQLEKFILPNKKLAYEFIYKFKLEILQEISKNEHVFDLAVSWKKMATISAIKNGYLEVIKLLVNIREQNISDKDLRDAMLCATSYGHIEIFHYLEKYQKCNTKINSSLTFTPRYDTFSNYYPSGVDTLVTLSNFNKVWKK